MIPDCLQNFLNLWALGVPEISCLQNFPMLKYLSLKYRILALWCSSCILSSWEFAKFLPILELLQDTWLFITLLWRSRESIYLGPVVQSVVSLTSSLRVISFTVLADSIYTILIFFAEKMWVAFALQKLLTFFQQTISAYLRVTRCKF